VERIRVVRIIDRLNVGGPAKHVTWLTAGLDPERFETTLITGVVPDSEGDMGYFARAAGVEPLVIEEMSRELSLGDVAVTFKILRTLFRLKPHIVHTHKAKAGAVGRLAATIYKWLTPSALRLRPRRLGVIHTYHGHVFHSYYGAAKTRLFLAIERALARFCADRIIAISDRQRDEILRSFKVGRSEQYTVIPLGIDLDEIASRRAQRGGLRRELGIGAGDVLIGVVGRLCEVKNHAMLIESAAKMKSGGAVFVIVGDGHLRAELEAQAQSTGLDGRVTFTGFRDDAASLYADFDIAALTSLNEGTPLTLIEAMASGRALVATEVGGVADLMGRRGESFDGFTVWDHGVTAPGRNAEAFVRGLMYLVERPELRREMGERGRAFVLSRLSKERLISDIENLYSRLIHDL
jgi:glycosyltransferase involved in cell wall biosynthesis